MRIKVLALGFKHLLLITSEKHMLKALYIFQKIFGNSLTVDDGNGLGTVETGDILLEDEEAEYLVLAKNLFSKMPEKIPDPKSWEDWYQKNLNLYEEYKRVHDKYHPPGKESQAYVGVRK